MNLTKLYLALPPPLQKIARQIVARPPLHYTLPNGITIEVGDRSDWAIYNDVFVVGEYDQAIDHALSTTAAGQRLRVVDLGANVGFFLLRLLGRARDRQQDLRIEGIAIEGAPITYTKLVSRVSRNDGLSGVKLLNNLCGSRSGHGFIDGGENSAGAVVGAQPDAGQRVEYLDLETVIDDWSTVTLLKCDIEGSEEALIRSYPELLAKLPALVIELHPMYCDSEFVKRAILDSGLELRRSIIGHNGGETCFFTRTRK